MRLHVFPKLPDVLKVGGITMTPHGNQIAIIINTTGDEIFQTSGVPVLLFKINLIMSEHGETFMLVLSCPKIVSSPGFVALVGTGSGIFTFLDDHDVC
jgi:hypothetical protein